MLLGFTKYTLGKSNNLSRLRRMPPRRSYDQYCSAARALDAVGDRWTLLIVRELLAGPRRYTDLHADLPGVSTDVLASRLKDMERDGLRVVVDASGNQSHVLDAVCRQPALADRRLAQFLFPEHVAHEVAEAVDDPASAITLHASEDVRGTSRKPPIDSPALGPAGDGCARRQVCSTEAAA